MTPADESTSVTTVPTAPALAAEGWQGRLRHGREGMVRFAFENPVLVKEFRTRMRGTRAYWLLLIYTLFLAGVLGLMYFWFEISNAQQLDGSGGATGLAQDLGRAIYSFVFIAQALMVALITPAITAGTLTIEREQRSYELLVTTPLKPSDLVRGKLSAAVAFVMLLLTASLPLVSISFMVGGVSPAEIFFSYLIIGLSAFVYGSLGIFWSATLRTTAAATVVTYLTVLALFILTWIPGLIASTMGMGMGPGGGGATAAQVPFQSLNPVTATYRTVQPEHFFAITLPSWVAAAVINLLAGLGISRTAMGRLEHFEPPLPAWGRLLTTMLWCAFGLFLFGALIGGTASNWTPSSVREPVGSSVILMLVMVALVTPVMNTGDLVVLRGESAVKRYLRGFLPHRAFADDLSCGFPLVLGWTIFLLALLPIGAALAGKQSVFPNLQVFVPAAILTLCVFAALAGVGNLLSIILPSRWAACVLTYLAGVVAMLLPYFTLFPWHQADRPREVQLWHQVLYLVPFEAISQLISPASFEVNRPPLALGMAVPMWIVTSLFYLTVAVLCFVLTTAQVAKVGERLQAR
ncbi:MAG: ABC transporter permease [Actinomycetota bacterium]